MMLTLVPAYGRDFRNEAEVKKAFHNNKDFKIQDIGCQYNGRFFSKSDSKFATADGYFSLKIRYKNLEEFVIIDLNQCLLKSAIEQFPGTFELRKFPGKFYVSKTESFLDADGQPVLYVFTEAGGAFCKAFPHELKQQIR